MNLKNNRKRTYKMNSLEKILVENENKKDFWTTLGVVTLILVITFSSVIFILEMKRLSGGY